MSLEYQKIAVVLFNLGGPDKLSSIRPFLYNLFRDYHIIRINFFLRNLFAFLISFFRYKKIRSSYALMGDGSPLLRETENQAKILEQRLNSDSKKVIFKVFISMRYWHPFSNETVRNIKKFLPNEILCLPLYPHFSTATTLSSIRDFKKSLKKNSCNIVTKSFCCYYNQEDFLRSHVNLLKNTLDSLGNFQNYVLIFSAHSLPQKFIDSGDPYQWQIEESVKNIIQKLNKDGYKIREKDWEISYQSKIGPIKWLKPSTVEVIENHARNMQNIILIPISFVSEHIEVLVELDIEYKEVADRYNVEFIRISTLRLEKSFIEALYKNVINMFLNQDSQKITSSNLQKNCPPKFSSCLYGKSL
ncbi:MAG: ferrochelatase [Rickettsia sp.]|nr:ferrochelatase [Rickettsia sp.]